MRSPIAILVAVSLAASSVRAGALDPHALVDRWLDAQNRGDFEGYTRLYAAGFVGVRRSGARATRLDRAGWIKDRERMFRSKMTVIATDRKVEPLGEGFRVTLTQTWASGRYKDVGTKELVLVPEEGELRIEREEMLESRLDLGIKNGALVVWDAGSPAETAAALDAAERLAKVLSTVVDFPSGFPTRLEGGVDGVKQGEAVVALGVCSPAEANAVVELFRRLGPRTSVRETAWKPRTKEKESSCPVFSAGDGWSWPGTWASAPAGGDTLTVVALRREDADRAREYRENLFVAVLVGKEGAVARVAAFKGEGDFADLEGLERSGAAVLAREKFVDAPCNGTDRHKYQVMTRTLRIEVKEGDIGKREIGRTVVARGRCSYQE